MASMLNFQALINAPVRPGNLLTQSPEPIHPGFLRLRKYWTKVVDLIGGEELVSFRPLTLLQQSMQYHERKIRKSHYIFVIVLFLLLASQSSSAQESALYGTAAFFDRPGGHFLADAAQVVLEFRFRHRKIIVTTDPNGDFSLNSAKAGKYCLVGVKTATGQVAKIFPKQVRCIVLEADKDKEFNIMLLEE